MYALRNRCVFRRRRNKVTDSCLSWSDAGNEFHAVGPACNVVLAGLPQRELDRVQSVDNAAARLSADARKYDHVTPLLMDLHWLRVPERVKFKLCVLMHRWSGAAIFDRAGSACRQYCSLSPALSVICWSCRAFNSPFNHRWPCVRCCWSTSVAQPTIWHSNIYSIIRHV